MNREWSDRYFICDMFKHLYVGVGGITDPEFIPDNLDTVWLDSIEHPRVLSLDSYSLCRTFCRAVKTQMEKGGHDVSGLRIVRKGWSFPE